MPTTHGRVAEIRDAARTSVYEQTHQDWHLHVVWADAPWPELVATERETWHWPGQASPGYGGAARQWALDTLDLGEWIVHLDDDNLLFPHYMERMSAAGAGYDFVSCDLLYLGRGAPHVLRGDDLRVGKVDTLSVMVRPEALREVDGWVEPTSYFSDGYTWARLEAECSGAYVDEVLAAHL
jgi:hypothetical protein